MYETLMANLKTAGADTDAALARFSGLRDLYGKYLCKFPADGTFAQIGPALAKEDFAAALDAVHTLKGVSGNLGLTQLYEACSAMVVQLRAQQYAAAKDGYAAVRAAYEQVCAVIGTAGPQS